MADLRDNTFGVEIEMTGITRNQAAHVLGDYFGSTVKAIGGSYDKHTVNDSEGRTWTIMYDGSIQPVSKNGSANDLYKVEFVTPICRYSDIETIQELIRALRKKGAVVNKSCGIHIHIGADKFNAKTLRNLVNIYYSKQDMIYHALAIEPIRERRYCQKTETDFISRINTVKPNEDQFKNIWYNGHDGSNQHYHPSRYHGLNLHSVFSKGTIEFRLFNSTLHAGKVKAYIQFCLAICNQALSQKSASSKPTVSDNEKYTFRTWLLRLGLIGEEFETARHHLLANLEGNSAWKNKAS